MSWKNLSGLCVWPSSVLIQAAVCVSLCSLCCIIPSCLGWRFPSHLNVCLVCTFKSYQSIMTQFIHKISSSTNSCLPLIFLFHVFFIFSQILLDSCQIRVQAVCSRVLLPFFCPQTWAQWKFFFFKLLFLYMSFTLEPLWHVIFDLAGNLCGNIR